MRGFFGRAPIDEATMRGLAQALARELAERHEAPVVAVGGDTRASTPVLTGWIAEALRAAGAQVLAAGTVPTPAVAHIVRSCGADAGIAISASHNPATDNGIKLFDGAGYKWTREREARLEARLGKPAISVKPGNVSERPDLAETWTRHVAATLPGRTPLAGLEVAVDAANGAGAPFARLLFERAGARVVALNDRPDGANINVECGSTHPQAVAAAVRDAGAALGVALDGDADRCILVDEHGEILDGDAILYLWARALADAGDLEPAAIVVTTMSNLGLTASLAADGIEVVRCGVGDRAVVETMRSRGIVLGGEQSGHVVHLGMSTTGDGLLTALHIAHLCRSAGRPLSELTRDLVVFPQVLINVAARRKPPFDSLPRLGERLAAIRGQLGSEGRVLLRYSGTEPLARVLVEGRDRSAITAMAAELADELRTELA